MGFRPRQARRLTPCIGSRAGSSLGLGKSCRDHVEEEDPACPRVFLSGPPSRPTSPPLLGEQVNTNTLSLMAQGRYFKNSSTSVAIAKLPREIIFEQREKYLSLLVW